MLDMQHRAVTAVREWNDRLGKDATYVVCSHGDVIKAIVADSLGLHLDQCQRIVADPSSLTVIRYTPLRPFLLRMNDTGGGVGDLIPRPAADADQEGSANQEGSADQTDSAEARGDAEAKAAAESDAVIGGGTGSAGG